MSGSIMLQGSMSDVGKSFLAAALCRIFKEDGYSPAPFKSQNMALNSYVTSDGLEIGRAQALQAQAAGLEPSVYMNPILLKPSSDIGSQVIVNGEVFGDMRAKEYFKYKQKLVPEIKKAYRKLSAEHDMIVIEGAGSPAELNLKKDDIVNMGLAKMLKAPVLLIGDIDRGGVFAQLLGTLSLLEEDERKLVKGLIVNRFRGDIRLFEDGKKIIEERSKLPVIGVVPHIECELEAEDSLSSKLLKRQSAGDIDIAAVRLPRISNFTDLDALMKYNGVSVRFVSSSYELGTPDLIIIPGTKSTISDMKWLRSCGLAERIISAAYEGIPVFGICGGYQMMGKKIEDPFCTEGGGSTEGLGLLECETVFEQSKTRKRISGKLCGDIKGEFSCLSGAGFYGYEIHMGKTEVYGSRLFEGGGSFRDNCAGCYIHGFFDSSDISGRFIRHLFEKKGISFDENVFDMDEYREMQLDILSRETRKALDMERIYRIIKEGI